MSRQPTQRSVFESMRRQSETVRVTQIDANERLGVRTNEARQAAAQAKRDADAATAAAAAATAEAAEATAATAQATASVNAAITAAGQANAAAAGADAAMARLARTRATTRSTVDDDEPNSDGSWSNALGLRVETAGEGLLAVVRVAVPVSGRQSVAGGDPQRLEFELRLNGTAVCSRYVSTTVQQMMNFTYAHTTPLPAGTSTFEVWFRGGSDGLIDDGQGDTAVRSITLLQVAA